MSNEIQDASRIMLQMSGAPGAGKSTLARLLRPWFNAVIIDHDVLKSSLLTSGTISFDQAAKEAYRLQWAIAKDVMVQGINVIVDCPCNYEEVIFQGSTLAFQLGFAYWYVECKVQDISLLDQRLRTRESMVSQRTAIDRPPASKHDGSSKEEALALFKRWIDHPYRPVNNVIIVDSALDARSNCNDVLAQLMPHRIVHQ